MKRFSPLAWGPVPGEFSGGGFEGAILDLPARPSSFWGVDRCLRIGETVDGYHSRVFHMGVFASAVELRGDFRDPPTDPRFHELQINTLDQFFSALGAVGIRQGRLEASYFGGAMLTGSGRHFPPDRVSKNFLKARGIKSVPVPTKANFYIGARTGLTGPRLEVACDGVEIGNVLFCCFKLRGRTLRPLNYLSVYAVGLERLLSVLNGGDFLHAVKRYTDCKRLIEKKARAARSAFFERDVLSVIFSAEALARIPDDVSSRQQQQVNKMAVDMRSSMIHLGLSHEDVSELIRFYRRCKY